MDSVSADLFFNYARAPAQFSSDQSKIDFFHGPFGKLDRQCAVRFIVFRDDEATTCLLVEAMHNSRTFFAADSRKGRTVIEQGVDQGVFWLTCAGMNYQRRRLVDDYQVIILKRNAERNCLRLII